MPMPTESDIFKMLMVPLIDKMGLDRAGKALPIMGEVLQFLKPKLEKVNDPQIIDDAMAALGIFCAMFAKVQAEVDKDAKS